jgi:2-oxoacid:acceptor oxidoreductase gamma subunit (pyruvate/2-ketoisovalerate family)
MKEIRLHGRGGQGVVKASHIVVKAAISGGTYGQFIPFFSVERKGSPVFGFLRLSNTPIRRKTQIYNPDILMIFDDSMVKLPATYAGLKAGGTVIINSVKPIEALGIPEQAGEIAIVNATGISEELFGSNMPNTSMLGALAKVTDLVSKDALFDEIAAAFGEKNRTAAQMAFDSVVITRK